MMRKSSEMFPGRHQLSKINGDRSSNKRKSNNPRLVDSESIRGSQKNLSVSRVSSQKKAVRLMLNDLDGNVVIDTPASQDKEPMKVTVRPFIQQSLQIGSILKDSFALISKQSNEFARSAQKDKVTCLPQLLGGKSGQQTMRTSRTTMKKQTVPKKTLHIRVSELVKDKHQTMMTTPQSNLIADDRTGKRPPFTAAETSRRKKHFHRTGDGWRSRPARNIHELETKFATVYGQSSILSATQRSISHNYNSNRDKKIVNIMQKLNSRFDPDRHRQRNDNIFEHLRQKTANLNRNRHTTGMMHTIQASSDLIMVSDRQRPGTVTNAGEVIIRNGNARCSITVSSSTFDRRGRAEHTLKQAKLMTVTTQPSLGKAGSSGFIPEVSQESLLE